MAVAKPVWWVSGLLTRFEEQLPCRIGPQTHHSRINVQQNKESLIHISQWKFSLVISGLTRTLTKINGMFCYVRVIFRTLDKGSETYLLRKVRIRLILRFLYLYALLNLHLCQNVKNIFFLLNNHFTSL